MMYYNSQQHFGPQHAKSPNMSASTLLPSYQTQSRPQCLVPANVYAPQQLQGSQQQFNTYNALPPSMNAPPFPPSNQQQFGPQNAVPASINAPRFTTQNQGQFRSENTMSQHLNGYAIPVTSQQKHDPHTVRPASVNSCSVLPSYQAQRRPQSVLPVNADQYPLSPNHQHQLKSQIGPLANMNILSTTTSRSQHLKQPIAIPATDSHLGSPFLRAYPLELEAYGISPYTFLEFLDEMNRVVVACPPVRVLGLAGDVVSFVPSVTAAVIGTSVSVAAKLTEYGMSKGRSELFLREANKNIFSAHGLHIDIVKLEVVAKVAQMPILGPEGKIDKSTRLLAPLSGSETDLSGQERRLVALAAWTSPLEVLPKEEQPTPENLNMWKKMHTYASDRQRTKEEGKVLDKRARAQEKVDKRFDKIRDDLDEKMYKLAKEEDRIRDKNAKKPEKMNTELQWLSEKRQKIWTEYEQEMAVERERGEKEDTGAKKDREEKTLRKILFLLIRNRDSGEVVVA